jgi:hypothetical protein
MIDGEANFKGQNSIKSMLRSARLLQSEIKTPNSKRSRPDKDFSIQSDAHERFYTLVEKVYLFKLQNGDLDQHTYSDVMTAVDDIMTPIKGNLNSEETQ